MTDDSLHGYKSNANHSLPKEFAAVTTNLSIHYLATATKGHLHAHATFSHKDPKTMVIVADDHGKSIAIGTASFFAIPIQ